MNFSSPNACTVSITIVALLIVLIQVSSNHQTSNGLIPKPGTLPLLNVNDTSASLSDPNLKIEIFATDLNKPTNMAFLDNADALVLEKQNGTVRKIANGSLLPDPLLDVNVGTFDTRGMLGIAIAKNQTLGKEYVFIYFTEAKDGTGDGEDKCYSFSRCIPEYLPNGNRLYRYELSEDGTKLINQKLLFSWPPFLGATHNGGEITVGSDNNIYVLVGNGEQRDVPVMNSKKNMTIDGRAGILVFDHDGKTAFSNGVLGSEDPLNKYYAYGIRNGFGLDFDPVTGKLWDTENGPEFGDEINIVDRGFNSGSMVIQGIWKYTKNEKEGKVESGKPDNLINFNGNGKYSAPELTWNQSIGPTAIKFLNSDKYGKEYQNDLFLGTVKPKGVIYHFDLNSKRTGLDLQGQLENKIVYNSSELTKNVFGKNFGIISDINVGPDGYLYIVSFTYGKIYRIIPT